MMSIRVVVTFLLLFRSTIADSAAPSNTDVSTASAAVETTDSVFSSIISAISTALVGSLPPSAVTTTTLTSSTIVPATTSSESSTSSLSTPSTTTFQPAPQPTTRIPSTLETSTTPTTAVISTAPWTTSSPSSTTSTPLPQPSSSETTLGPHTSPLKLSLPLGLGLGLGITLLVAMALLPLFRKCRKRMKAEKPRFKVEMVGGTVVRLQGSEKAEMEGSGISHVEKGGEKEVGAEKVELADSKAVCVEMAG